MAIPKDATELSERFHVKVVLDNEGHRTQYISPKDPEIAKNDNIWFSSLVVKELLHEYMQDFITRAQEKAGEKYDTPIN